MSSASAGAAAPVSAGASSIAGVPAQAVKAIANSNSNTLKGKSFLSFMNSSDGK